MAAPTFLAKYDLTFDTSTANKTTPSISVVPGDVVAMMGMHEASTEGYTITDGHAGGLPWVLTEVNVSTYCRTQMWLALIAGTTSGTVTVNSSGTIVNGACMVHFRGGAGAVGTPVKTNVALGAPTLSITTVNPDSAIIVMNSDFLAVDGASRTWRANFGSLTENTYFRNAADLTAYFGYHANAGSPRTNDVGLSAPGSQKYAIIAVEVKGTADNVADWRPADPAPYPFKDEMIGY